MQNLKQNASKTIQKTKHVFYKGVNLHLSPCPLSQKTSKTLYPNERIIACKFSSSVESLNSIYNDDILIKTLLTSRLVKSCWAIIGKTKVTATPKYRKLEDYLDFARVGPPHCIENLIYVFLFWELRGLLLILTFLCLWAIYIFPGSVHILLTAE
jgi:hypothetical protein